MILLMRPWEDIAHAQRARTFVATTKRLARGKIVAAASPYRGLHEQLEQTFLVKEGGLRRELCEKMLEEISALIDNEKQKIVEWMRKRYFRYQRGTLRRDERSFVNLTMNRVRTEFARISRPYRESEERLVRSLDNWLDMSFTSADVKNLEEMDEVLSEEKERLTGWASRRMKMKGIVGTLQCSR